MQGTGHAAVVVYRKCLVTKQIRSNNVPAGFMVFSFEPLHILVSSKLGKIHHTN
jgi:hypothetical protein